MLPFFYRKLLGNRCSLLASTLLISSPLISYYNRLYIHESLLATLALWGTLQLISYLQKPSKPKAIILGILIGLMFATKASFIFIVSGWMLASIFFLRQSTRDDATKKVSWIAVNPYWRDLFLVIVSALLIASYFYSNGFKDSKGILAAFESYFVYELMPGHKQPFGAYWQWLIWPKYSLGQVWTECTIAGAAIFSLLYMYHCATTCFLALSIFIQLLIYSCLTYKTLLADARSVVATMHFSSLLDPLSLASEGNAQKTLHKPPADFDNKLSVSPILQSDFLLS